MYKKIPGFLLLLYIALTFTACRKQHSGIRYIPKDALGVFTLNAKSLGKKIAWSVLGDSRALHQFLTIDENKPIDIQKTGIDINATVFAFGLPDSRLENNYKFFLVLPLKNTTSFEHYLQGAFPSSTLKKENDISFLYIDDYTLLAWKNNIALGAFTSPPGLFQNPDEAVTGILKKEILKHFALPENQSITTQQSFMDLMKRGDDISFWFNYEAFVRSVPQDEMGSAGIILASQKNLLNDTYLSGGINFRKGRITIDGKYHYNPTVKTLAEVFTDVRYNDELLKRMPGKQMNVMTRLHLNPEGLPALIDSMGVLPLTKMALKENGFEPDAVFHVFDGDFLFTIVDFDFKKLSDYFSFDSEEQAEGPLFQNALTFKIRDRDAFKQVLDFALKNKLIKKDAAGIYEINANFLAYKQDYAVVSTDRETVSRLRQNTAENKWEIPAEVKKHPFGFYADIENTFKDTVFPWWAGDMLPPLIRITKDIKAYGGRVEGDYSPFHVEISFRDKEENSLLQLIQLKNNINEGK